MTSDTQRNAFVYVGMAGEGGSPGHGLCRMDTGGGPWTRLSGGLPADPEVRSIALHPSDPDIVFAATHDGVYRSSDRGDSWKKTAVPGTPGAAWSLMFHPNDPRVMFAGFESAQVYRTGDGGDTWTPLKVDVEFPSATMVPKETPKRIIGLSADPAYPDEMYGAVEIGGLIRSLDGGESWEAVTDGLYVNDDSIDVHGVVASRAEPHTVLIITRIGMFKSTDRGEHWRHVGVEKLGPRGTYCRSLREAPDEPRTLYLACGAAFGGKVGAVYRSRDLGETWDRLDLGATPSSTLFGVAVNPSQPTQIFCCSRDGEVFATADGGATWDAHPLPASASEVRAIACG